jgi:type I restriction enzyme S subunit
MEVKPSYKQTEVGVIPEEWEVAQISDVCRLVNGRGFKPFEWQTTGLPIIRIQNLNGAEDFNYYSGQYNPKILIEHGQLLFAWSGSRGTSFGPHVWNGGRALLNYHTWKVEVNESSVTPDFLLFALRQLTSYIEGRAHGASALVHTQKWEMEKFPIVKPKSLPEQRAIATALSDVDGLLGGLDRLIAKKRDLKQAAMQQLLTGQTRLPGFHGKWEAKTFGEVAVPRRERIDPRRTGVHDFCIELEHIESGSGQILGSTSTGTQSSLKSVFHPGDVLFGKLRAYLRKYWRATRQGVCSTEIWVLVPRGDAATSEFLFQIVQTDDFIDAASNSYGTHMPRSDWNAVQNHELKMPPLPEQTAIASVLSEMDGELAVLEQRREKTRALKQAMMQELLTGRTRLV